LNCINSRNSKWKPKKEKIKKDWKKKENKKNLNCFNNIKEKKEKQELERFQQQQQREQQQQLLQQQMIQQQQQNQQMLNTPMSSTETLFLQRQAEKSIQMQMQTQMMLDQVSNQFEKILKFMENVDKRISSLENLTSEILTKQVVIMDQQQNTPSLTKVVENVKQLEEDQKLAKQLQEQFNSESVAPDNNDILTETVECPKCSKELKLTEMDEHIDKCMTEDEKKNKSGWFSFFQKEGNHSSRKRKRNSKTNHQIANSHANCHTKEKDSCSLWSRLQQTCHYYFYNSTNAYAICSTNV